MMELARQRMDKYEVALSILAQGEKSPHRSDELAAELERAKARLEKHMAPKLSERPD